jgi:phospholipase/carboxylesterase
MTLDYRLVEGDPGKPVLVLLHGTGGSPEDLIELGTQLSPGSTMLAPAGPVSEHGMARWFRRLREGVFDYEDVVARANQLADFILAASRKHDLTGRRTVAVGFSNGANIAAAVALLRPDALTELAAFAAMNPVPDPPELDLSGTRAFLSNGTADPMAPLPSTEDLVARLRSRDAEVTTHRHAGGHQITLEALQAAQNWLGQNWLGPAS